LGTDPIALLIYDRAGNFSAQFMKRNRTSAPENVSASSGPNNSRAQGGYDAYFGTYTVDDEHGRVTQRLVGALSGENVGQELTRSLSIISSELFIQVETAKPSGERLVRILRWRRSA
jgi:Lipocalin-like domain